MHTIALVSQKGGTGKSTLAIGLAIAAMQDGHKVSLLEADPQGTVSNWHKRRAQPEPPVERVIAAEIEHRIPFLDRCGVTLGIIDTAGGCTEASETAIRMADLCLIPARPSPADIEAAAPTLASIPAHNKPFAFVLNQAPVRSFRLNKAAATLNNTATSLNAKGVLALPYIVLRNNHQDALGAGLAVSEYAPGSKSAAEVQSLWQWVWSRVAATSPLSQQAVPANAQTEMRVTG